MKSIADCLPTMPASPTTPTPKDAKHGLTIAAGSGTTASSANSSSNSLSTAIPALNQEMITGIQSLLAASQHWEKPVVSRTYFDANGQFQCDFDGTEYRLPAPLEPRQERLLQAALALPSKDAALAHFAKLAVFKRYTGANWEFFVRTLVEDLQAAGVGGFAIAHACEDIRQNSESLFFPDFSVIFHAIKTQNSQVKSLLAASEKAKK